MDIIITAAYYLGGLGLIFAGAIMATKLLSKLSQKLHEKKD